MSNAKKRFNESIEGIKNVFKEKPNGYFYTEEEIHSYFYHLCISNDFNCDLFYKNHTLVHSQYTVPFRYPTKRPHIDIVLLNVEFIKYLIKNKISSAIITEILSGIGTGDYNKYIKEHEKYYNDFCSKTNESILLYAVEFKYYRHNYTNTQNAKNGLDKDLKRLEKFNTHLYSGINYCENSKLLTFIADEAKKEINNAIINLTSTSIGKKLCSLYLEKIEH